MSRLTQYSWNDLSHGLSGIRNLLLYRYKKFASEYICGWLGVVCMWSTHATVGSERGWPGVVDARQADLSGWLGHRVGAPQLGAF